MFCSKRCMTLALGILISAFASMGFLSLRLSRAAEGFEDENGFHFTANSKNGSVQKSSRTVPSAAIKRRVNGLARPAAISNAVARAAH